jgi:DNA-binding response OmpR family regulator
MAEPARRVLVVDDDDVFRSFTARVLASSGFVAAEAQNGAIAVEKIEEFKPDLMLLDLCMPVLDGWGVLERLDDMEAPPKVLVVSGVREVTPPDGLCRWINGYLFKPFRARQLLERCEDVLARPAVTYPRGDRKEARRTFIADATILGKDRTVIALGLLVEVSAGGLRLRVASLVKPNQYVTVVFRVPGHAQHIEVAGTVQWSDPVTMAVGLAIADGADDAVLRALVDLD